MKVLFSWLKDFIDFDLSPEELAEKLSFNGIEVEKIEKLKYSLKNVVVGRIKEIKPHPKAERLKICQVDTGKRILKIVCGAPNIKKKQCVPVALAGAILADGVKIKKTLIRGISSDGMLCSARELGISSDHSGILILDRDAKLGEDLIKVLSLDDAVLDCEVTPNRPDCLSIIGMAREVGAIVGKKISLPSFQVDESKTPLGKEIQVKIKAPDLCPRYTARLIKDVTIEHSPWWMQRRLECSGVRAINNIVDVTNYVLLEIGQPLHAFDYNLLSGAKIIVRRASPGEICLTLDGEERVLTPDMLVIADQRKSVALAGIMGGATSEVSERTKNILLESAYFHPPNVLKTSGELGLRSESSLRFERGIDPNNVALASNRAIQLMKELGGGEVFKGIIDVYPKLIKPKIISFRPETANKILGTDIPKREMIRIFKSLDFSLKDNKKLKVAVPTFRPDIEREIDLIEEVGRIYGLNRIASTLPESSGKIGELSFAQRVERIVRDSLIKSGLSEIISFSFSTSENLDKLRIPKDSPLRQQVELKNPISEEWSSLRTLLLPGLIETAKYNINHGQNNVQIFEIGRVYAPAGKGKLPEESLKIGVLLTGFWQSGEWYSQEEEVNFFDLKGILELLMEDLRIKNWKLEEETYPFLHPGKSAALFIGKRESGFLGEIHPQVQLESDLPAKIYIFELKFDSLVKNARLYQAYPSIPRYPGIDYDISILVDKEKSSEEIEKIILKNGGKLLKRVKLFDLYSGKQIPEHKKSLAYRLSFWTEERTLLEDEVKAILDKVIKGLEKNLGAEIRR